MSNSGDELSSNEWPTLAAFPRPAKALVSVVILTLAVAMTGALGQIIVHDIIPTFYSDQSSEDQSTHTMEDMKSSKEGEESVATEDDEDDFGELEVCDIANYGTTLLPFGPRVTLTASARKLTPSSIDCLASELYEIIFTGIRIHLLTVLKHLKYRLLS